MNHDHGLVPPSGGADEGSQDSHWFEAMADRLGRSYLRYSFTRGTDREVAALVELLELDHGARILDIGCGPGRHALALAAAGHEVVGVDISARFVELATEAAVEAGVADRARFVRADARALELPPDLAGPFDAAISLCQGAFGLSAGPGSAPTPARELDEPILAAMAGAVTGGGRLAVTAFSAYFQVRYLEPGDTFDAVLGVNHEDTSVRDEAGVEHPAELWTTCYTPRELRLLARLVGLEVDGVHGAAPGDYRRRPPTVDDPELLLLATG